MYAGMTCGYDCAYHQHQERKDCKMKLNISPIYICPKKLVTLNMWCSEAYKSDRIYSITLCPMEPAKLTHLNSKCVMHHGQSRRSYPTDLLKRSIQCNDFKFYQRLMSGLQQYKLGRKLTRN